MPIADREPVSRRSLATNAALTEAEAATRLGLKVATLRAWRHRTKGPAFVRLGRAVRYLTTDLDEFLRANRHAPASDSAKSLIIDEA